MISHCNGICEFSVDSCVSSKFILLSGCELVQDEYSLSVCPKKVISDLHVWIAFIL